jgi:hypothetical protein
MAKSGSTPIQFSANAFLIAAVFCALLGLVAVFSAIEASKPAVLILAVFWGVVSGFCVKSWRAAR